MWIARHCFLHGGLERVGLKVELQCIFKHSNP
jgi:hypothetical protein